MSSVQTKELYQAYYQHLLAFISSRISSKEDAEDIAHDVFYKLSTSVDKITDTTKLKSWMFTVAKNSIIDFYRKSKPFLTETEIPVRNLDEKSEAQIDFENCLRPFINNLSEETRQAILLSEIEGKSQTEISEAMGIPYSSLKSRIQRGRQKLQEMFLECCRFEFDKNGNIIDYIPQQESCESRGNC